MIATLSLLSLKPIIQVEFFLFLLFFPVFLFYSLSFSIFGSISPLIDLTSLPSCIIPVPFCLYYFCLYSFSFFPFLFFSTRDMNACLEKSNKILWCHKIKQKIFFFSFPFFFFSFFDLVVLLNVIPSDWKREIFVFILIVLQIFFMISNIRIFLKSPMFGEIWNGWKGVTMVSLLILIYTVSLNRDFFQFRGKIKMHFRF